MANPAQTEPMPPKDDDPKGPRAQATRSGEARYRATETIVVPGPPPDNRRVIKPGDVVPAAWVGGDLKGLLKGGQLVSTRPEVDTDD